MTIWWDISDGANRQADFKVTGGPRIVWADQEQDAYRAVGETLASCAAAAAVGEMEMPFTLSVFRWSAVDSQFYRIVCVTTC